MRSVHRVTPSSVNSLRSRLWGKHSLSRLAGVTVLCLCASYLTLWRPAVLRTRQGLLTSLSGHQYHPKLCNSLSNPVEASHVSAGGCDELHDPDLAQKLVDLPESLQLLSRNPQVARLKQLLQTAVQQQWPLPLARRVVSVLLQGLVPPVVRSGSSSSSSSDDPKQLELSAIESGHAAGWKFASESVSVLKQITTSKLVPCSFDLSLPTEFHTRFLFTASWPDSIAGSGSSTAALGNSVLQLLHAAALLPPGHAFISVFVPSTAADSSLAWLDLLHLLASALGIPVRLHLDKPPATTSSIPSSTPFDMQTPSSAAAAVDPSAALQLTQPSHSSSSSQAYNAALSPFFPAQTGSASTLTAATNGRNLHQQQQQQASSQLRRKTRTTTDATAAGGNGGSRVQHGSCPAGQPSPACYHPDFVVLFDPQLFFCAGDLVRLMEYPEDLVCGLQLDAHSPAQHRQRQLMHAGGRHPHQQAAGSMAAAPDSSSSQEVQEGPMGAAVTAAGLAELAPEVPKEFQLHSLRAAYDAAREITGEMFSAHAPYFSHAPSLQLAKAGLPVPVYCCWGGVAKLSGGPLAAGLRLRRGEEGECHPPDPWTLLCDDLWRTGHSHILLDPGVRTSSQLATKSLLEDPHFPFFYYTQNWETTAWFDIHPLLPLQYWNQSLAHQSNNSSVVGKDIASGDNDPAAEQHTAAAADDGTYEGFVGWKPADWQPGEQQMCCEGRQWAGGDRPNQPTDCRRRSALRGKNFTAIFLERCAASLQASSGRVGGTDCR